MSKDISDWRFIEEHMGGHDEDGMPNFMNQPGFYDEKISAFDTFQDAMTWAKNNPGKAIARSPDGIGYIKK